jgi:hypothetical protein
VIPEVDEGCHGGFERVLMVPAILPEMVQATVMGSSAYNLESVLNLGDFADLANQLLTINSSG